MAGSSRAAVASGTEREGNLYTTVMSKAERPNGRSSGPDLGPAMMAIPDEAQLRPSPTPPFLPSLARAGGISSSSLVYTHATDIPPPPPSTKDDRSLLLRPLPPLPDAAQFLPTSCAMGLWEVANPKKVTLPQLFRIEGDYNCGSISLDKGETVIVLYKKMVMTVQGSNGKGQELVFFQNSTTTMSPITDKAQQHDRHLTPRQLLAMKQLPPVVRVQEPFTDSKGYEVPAEGLLFFKSSTNVIKSISRKVRKSTIKAKDQMGRSVSIAADSPTTFSLHPDDIKLYLAEVVHHCQLPVKVLLEGDLDSTDVIVLEEVHLQGVLVGQRYGRVNDSSHFELATNAKVQMTKVALADKKLEESIYAVAYESVSPQPTTTGTRTTHSSTTHTENNDEDTAGSSSGYATVMEWRQLPPKSSRVSTTESRSESHFYSEVLISPRPHPPCTSPNNSSGSQLLQTPAPSSHLALEAQDSASERYSPLQPTISHDQRTSGPLLSPLQLLGMQGAASATDSDEEERRRRNVNQLKQLGVGDILHLLEAMHLSEYRPTFEREFIDGHTLSSLTNRILLQDLNMTKELHRLRLMEVIEGEKPVTDFLHKN